MGASDLSTWNVTRIDNVVHLLRNSDSGYIRVNEMNIKRFGPRRFHGLVLKTEGVSRYVVENRFTLDMGPGDLLYLPQGREYYVQTREPGGCFCVNFHIEGDPRAEPFVMMPRRPEKWTELFSAMVRCWTYRQPGYMARLRAQLYDMLATVEEDRHARYLPEHHTLIIRQRMEKLEGDLANEISVTELASDCGMSETYFRRLFRELYGLSPKQYIQEARFRQARALLSGSGASIAYVAEASGFPNLYHFSRAFRAHEGMSPSEYRKQH